MNPLQRRLFRLQQPGMSRQPMGILASSPELITAAQKALMQGQPMQAANGASVNTGRKVTVSGQEYTITNQGVFDSRGAPVTNPNVIAMIQKQNVIDAANPVSGMLRQFDVGNVDLSAALTDATGRKPIGQSEGGRERTEKLTQVPGKIAEGVESVLNELTRTRGPALNDIYGPFPDTPLDKFVRSFTAGDKLQAMSDESSLEAVSGEAPTSILGAPEVLGTVFGAGEAAKPKGTLAEQIAAGMEARGKFPDRPSGYTPSFPTAAESLAASRLYPKVPPEGPPTDKPTTGGDQTTGGEGDKAGTTSSAATNKAIDLLQQNLTNLQTGSGKVNKLSPDQATNQSVLDDFSYETAQFISPEEVDLNKIDQAAKDLMGFDPKAAGEKKETAFWMGVMKAGLAMAAGESENAITNIAKGLSYGLDSYGKDIALLNEQEREDRKEFRQLKVQMIKDERSFNIAQAGAQNTHNQHIADATNRYNMNKATLGIQEAKNIRDAEYQQANLALAMSQFENSIIKDMALLQQKGEEIEIKRGTLEATKDALTPPEIRALKEINYIDSEGNFTQKAIDVFGSEAAAVKAAIGGSLASRETEGDRDAAALSRAITARLAGQPISTDDLARLPKEFREDMTLFDDFIKQSGAQAASPAAPQVGSIVNQNGKRFKITAVDQDGKITGYEEIK